MDKRKTCSVDGCGRPVHAKGYCRKHYGQIWRRGEIKGELFNTDDFDDINPEQDRRRALERELRKTQNMYQQVVGFEGRLKWRKEMEAVKKEIARISPLEAVGAV